jgi:acetamidase/formamidase
MAEYYLDDRVTQPFWDHSVEPRLTINPGDTVVLDCAEPCGQVTPEWDTEQLKSLDFSRVHALNGSIYVNGAEPGDALEVEILEMHHKGWGWTGHIPGFGLLAEDFDFTYMHQWRLLGDICQSSQDARIALPFEPHIGCIGVAPAEAGRLNTVPPRANGGNMDVRDMTIGATVWLPVLVKGALFAAGDCHAAQGQGEVCGTGIESPMTITLRLNLRKAAHLKEVQLQRPGPLTRLDAGGYHITTAHGPDLMRNAQNAVRYMIDWISATHGLDRSLAYALCSVAGDLKISEIVDAPNWIVSFHMPRMIFSGLNA